MDQTRNYEVWIYDYCTFIDIYNDVSGFIRERVSEKKTL